MALDGSADRAATVQGVLPYPAMLVTRINSDDAPDGRADADGLADPASDGVPGIQAARRTVLGLATARQTLSGPMAARQAVSCPTVVVRSDRGQVVTSFNVLLDN